MNMLETEFALYQSLQFLFNIKAKGHEGHLHCSTLTLQYKFKQQYVAADKSYLGLLSSNNR